jgi:transposase-like protein
LGVDLADQKELLGLRLGENEGAKFWLSCLTDLQNRGLRDIFVACIDGLSGFPQAIHAAYPQTSVQLCIVHLLRAASWAIEQIAAEHFRTSVLPPARFPLNESGS